MPKPDVNDMSNSQYAIKDTYLVEGMEEMARTNIARAEQVRKLETMLAQLKEASRRHRWRPIETAPRDGTPVLLCGGQDDCADVIGLEEERLFKAPCRAMWDGVCWIMAYADHGWANAVYEHPSHWMPLPEPPHPRSPDD